MNHESAVQASRAVLLRSMLLEARYTFRELVPARMLRVLVFLALCGLETALCLLIASNPQGSRTTLLQGIVGFLQFNLLFAIAAAARALSRRLASPERFALFQLAPISSNAALLHVLAPTVFAALGIVALVGFPFVILAALRDPWLALALTAGSLAVFAWSVLAAVAMATFLGRRIGRARGAMILRALSLPLGVGAVLGFRTVSRFSDLALPFLALVIATPIVLPPLAARASGAFVALLLGREVIHEAKEPHWGSPGWLRTIAASLFLPAVLGLVIAGPLLVFRPDVRPVLAGLFTVVVVAAPLECLLQPEMARPDRLRLAPNGAAYRRRLIVHCGAAAWAIALLFSSAIALEGNRWRWLLAVAVSSILFPFTFFADSRSVRSTAQVFLTTAAVCSAALWS